MRIRLLLVTLLALVCLEGLQSLPAWGASNKKGIPVATFILSTAQNNPTGATTGATLNWMAHRFLQQAAQKKGLRPLDRGLFFSNAGALNGLRWRTRARREKKEAELYFQAKDARVALDHTRRAVQFYGYAHPYYFEVDTYQKLLLYLGVLTFRDSMKKKGEEQDDLRKRALRSLRQSLLINPNPNIPEELSSASKRLIRAMRCRVGRGKMASLVIDGRDPRAEIYLNTRFLGFGKVTIPRIPAGRYLFSVRLDGKRPWGRRIDLRPGQKKTLRAWNRSSPQSSFYKRLCQTFRNISEEEQLSYELRKVTKHMRIKRLLIGCFDPSSSGRTGTLHWVAIDHTKSAKGRQGQMSIPADFRAQQRKVLTLLQLLHSKPSRPRSLKIQPYRPPRSRGSCPDPYQMTLPPIEKSPKPRMCNVSPGDVVVVYMRRGYRVQGEVMRMHKGWLTLQVAEESNAPYSLREVQIDCKSSVKGTWILGPQQGGGVRVGEQLIVKTTYGFSIMGILLGDDGENISLKTRRGKVTIPWKMIRKAHQRDR